MGGGMGRSPVGTCCCSCRCWISSGVKTFPTEWVPGATFLGGAVNRGVAGGARFPCWNVLSGIWPGAGGSTHSQLPRKHRWQAPVGPNCSSHFYESGRGQDKRERSKSCRDVATHFVTGSTRQTATPTSALLLHLLAIIPVALRGRRRHLGALRAFWRDLPRWLLFLGGRGGGEVVEWYRAVLRCTDVQRRVV